MKRVLGLNIGTASIGWAYVLEAEKRDEQSKILDMGVRVNPLSTISRRDFERGRSQTSNSIRTVAKARRRVIQRFKLRRQRLIKLLKDSGIISDTTPLTEVGKGSTFKTLEARAKAATERIELEDLARVLLSINRKRGYKSCRKVKGYDKDQMIDGMEVAKHLHRNNLTPGQFCYQLLVSGQKELPEFYRSDLLDEYDKVWRSQSVFYPEVLDGKFKNKLGGQNRTASIKLFKDLKQVKVARIRSSLQIYKLRSEAIDRQLPIEKVAVVLIDIRNHFSSVSGYLGMISDKSKELYFNDQTVGENLYDQIKRDPHSPLKNQVFYRQDYVDEFEKIWETQSRYHIALTKSLKREIRDRTIFYQRRLGSRKNQVRFCRFESKVIKIDGRKRTVGSRGCCRASQLFQQAKIWQDLSAVKLKDRATGGERDLDQDEKEFLFSELNIKGRLSKSVVLKLLDRSVREWDLDYKEIQGNETNRLLYEAYQAIAWDEGYDLDISRMGAKMITKVVVGMFEELGIDISILEFDAELDLKNKDFENQPSFKLWHLLYSYDGDSSGSGTDSLYRKLEEKFGFKGKHAKYLAKIYFEDGYGSLSTKALSRIYPYLREHRYDDACALAGYDNSMKAKVRGYRDHLELLPKNSLFNGVVERILNQMVNLVNSIVDDSSLGKPDEIRIQLDLNLKENRAKRARRAIRIRESTINNKRYRSVLRSEFGIKDPSRNDLIRYSLYEELKGNGYRTLYSDSYISKSQLFSGEVDIEHIIPRSRLFDDSYSNKTLEFRDSNIEKGDQTAFDYIEDSSGADALEGYVEKIERYYVDGHISKAKYMKLLKRGDDIGYGSVERDIYETQYVARKAKEMLLELCGSVVSTSYRITARLREDWGLTNTIHELNLDRYRSMGMTEWSERKDGQRRERILSWSQRNDHRYNALDALVVAFTQYKHIKYLGNLNSRRSDSTSAPGMEEELLTYRSDSGKRLFWEPILNFNDLSKQYLAKVLVSHKAKNRAVTRNLNKGGGSRFGSVVGDVVGSDVGSGAGSVAGSVVGSDVGSGAGSVAGLRPGSEGVKVQSTLTPRGKLHKETIYGSSMVYVSRFIRVGANLDINIVDMISIKKYRDAIKLRIESNGGDISKAFGGKNAPYRTPIVDADGTPLPKKIKIVWREKRYTIRKSIDPDLNIDRVLDLGIRRILQRRLDLFDGDKQRAFSNLEDNPIWVDQKRKVALKRVTLESKIDPVALHSKRDHEGNLILDSTGEEVPTDYVSTNNNHHVAIYRDRSGALRRCVVSLLEAVTRANTGSAIIEEPGDGWELLFTLKRNEMFVIGKGSFDPTKVDLLDPNNRELISPRLFRVQKLTSKCYCFNNHIEAIDVSNRLQKNKSLATNNYYLIESVGALKRIVDKMIKVRIDHLGHVVGIGEY